MSATYATRPLAERVDIAIGWALYRHRRSCGGRVVAVQLSPQLVRRLGRDEFRGVPIESFAALRLTQLAVVCAGKPAALGGRAQLQEVATHGDCDRDRRQVAHA